MDDYLVRSPTSCCEVRRFTMMANYYRRFVGGYSEVVALLTALGSPNAQFVTTSCGPLRRRRASTR